MRQKTELCKLETEYFYLGGFLISMQYQQTPFGPDLGCAMYMVIGHINECWRKRLLLLPSLICADCIPFPAVSKSLVWAVTCAVPGTAQDQCYPVQIGFGSF